MLSMPIITKGFITNQIKLKKENDEKFKKIIYSNKLSNESDIKDFVLEGEAILSFPEGKLRMRNKLDTTFGKKANFVLWCPEDFPKDISIRWNFKPISEPGLCILFFGARGIGNVDIFSHKLNKRTGDYKQYHSGDINTYHLSYFRRKHKEERAFHTCNLRKSKGFHMVAQGADPIPSVEDVVDSYKLRIDILNYNINFFVNDLLVLNWKDDGKTFGEALGNGKIGLRQMAPLIGEYSDLEILSL